MALGRMKTGPFNGISKWCTFVVISIVTRVLTHRGHKEEREVKLGKRGTSRARDKEETKLI